MIVRKAQVTDWQIMAELLRAFREDPLTPPWFGGTDEHPNAERVLVSFLAMNTSFLVLHDDDVVGMLLSVKSYVPFTNNQIVEELAWFVREEKRGSRAGLLLLNAWEKMIDELKQKGSIVAGILHTMVDSPVDLERRGYRIADQTYVR